MTPDEIEARFAMLEATCAELRAQLAEARLHVAPTMKNQLRCPACLATRIAHVNHIPDQGQYSGGMLTLARDYGRPDPINIGSLEAFACTSCGLVELHVAVPGSLRDFEGQITILDGGRAEVGPYR